MNEFIFLNRWSEAECVRQQLSVTPENQRLILGDALSLVRFPLMSKEEFTAGPAQSGLLNYSEVVWIYVLCYTSCYIYKLKNLNSENLYLNFIGLIFILIFHTESQTFSGISNYAAVLYDRQGTDCMQVSTYKE